MYISNKEHIVLTKPIAINENEKFGKRRNSLNKVMKRNNERKVLRDITQIVENNPNHQNCKFSLMPLLRRCPIPEIGKHSKPIPFSVKQIRRKRIDEKRTNENKSINYLYNKLIN